MSEGSGFKSIRGLIDALTARVKDLESGRLGLEGLDAASEEARELHERIIVLRHKAREAKVRSTDLKPTPSAPPAGAQEPPNIRLDTQPPADERQITLIDAIAETEKSKKGRAATRKDEPASAPRKATVADRLEHAPIKDLVKAIPLSQKFWFIAELFNKDAGAFDQAIKRINGMDNLAEARAFAETEVLRRAKKAPGDDVRAAFMDLIERRFK